MSDSSDERAVAMVLARAFGDYTERPEDVEWLRADAERLLFEVRMDYARDNLHGRIDPESVGPLTAAAMDVIIEAMREFVDA
jgi:hypothetical protein